MARRGPTHAEILREMSRRDTDECVEWTFIVDQCGYGRARYRGRTRAAHRSAVEMEQNVVLPRQAQVMHLCNNKRCVNLRHLKIGDAQENTRAAFADGLIRPARGARLPQTKLTEEDVRSIRSSTERGVDLARRYGVCPATICYVRSRRNWRYVP